MRHFHYRRNPYHCPTLNVDRVWTLITEQHRKAYENRTDKAPVIDAAAAGFFKVLGSGVLPKQPFILRTKFVSRRAEDKIRAAGGSVELVA